MRRNSSATWPLPRTRGASSRDARSARRSANSTSFAPPTTSRRRRARAIQAAHRGEHVLELVRIDPAAPELLAQLLRLRDPLTQRIAQLTPVAAAARRTIAGLRGLLRLRALLPGPIRFRPGLGLRL